MAPLNGNESAKLARFLIQRRKNGSKTSINMCLFYPSFAIAAFNQVFALIQFYENSHHQWAKS